LRIKGVVSPSLLNHGRVGLAHVGGHARSHAKPHESRIYDSGEADYLSCARGSRIPYSSGGICCDLHDLLRAAILCAITPISPFVAAVLWLGTAALDSLGDRTYGCFCDPM
jgi:hypothetical protein